MPEQRFGLLFHATGSPPWLVRSAKVSTSSVLYPGHFRILSFIDCPDIQFFDSPLAQSLRLHLATYHSLCSTCATYGTPCHAIGHQLFPTQPFAANATDLRERFLLLAPIPAFSRRSWGRQFNLKVSRASCCGSKHSPGPTICLNHIALRKRFICGRIRFLLVLNLLRNSILY